MTRLPTHPRTGLRAVGITAKGRVVWPILGAEDDPTNPVQPPAKTGEPTGEDSFPANTPWQDMTPGQQVNYWKHQARRHESRVKALGDLTPEQITELRDKASKHDALEHDLMSDKDKAVADAKTAAANETRSQFVPKLVRAEFRAELKGRVPDDQLNDRLNTILEPLDSSKFLTDSGDVDAAKVAAFVDGIAPAKGPETQRRGPSPQGHGRRESTATGSSVAAGRELYRSRHPKPA